VALSSFDHEAVVGISLKQAPYDLDKQLLGTNGIADVGALVAVGNCAITVPIPGQVQWRFEKTTQFHAFFPGR
jgi:hypothetical protein